MSPDLVNDLAGVPNFGVASVTQKFQRGLFLCITGKNIKKWAPRYFMQN